MQQDAVADRLATCSASSRSAAERAALEPLAACRRRRSRTRASSAAASCSGCGRGPRRPRSRPKPGTSRAALGEHLAQPARLAHRVQVRLDHGPASPAARPVRTSAPASRSARAARIAGVAQLERDRDQASRRRRSPPAGPRSRRRPGRRARPRARSVDRRRGRRSTRRTGIRSSARRASGPVASSRASRARWGPGSGRCAGRARRCGLWPKTPLKNAGSRIEPPMSVPSPNGANAGADRGALAARGAAGGAGRVVGVVGAPPDAVLGLDPQRQLGGVGDPERDRAGVDQPLRRGRRASRRPARGGRAPPSVAASRRPRTTP